MNRIKHTLTIVLIVILSCIATTIFCQADRAKITGTWNMTVTVSQGSGNPTFDLVQSDTTVTGKYHGTFGEAPVTGSVKGNKIILRFSAANITMIYTGTVEGNTMKGTVDLDSYGEGTFTGEKKQ